MYSEENKHHIINYVDVIHNLIPIIGKNRMYIFIYINIISLANGRYKVKREGMRIIYKRSTIILSAISSKILLN